MASSRSLRSMFDLSGQTALITGGSRGIGYQMGEALGEFGAKLIITARKEDQLKEAVDAYARQGVEAEAIVCDLGKPGEADRVVEEIAARGGRVDILVNNAGTSWGSKTEEHPVEAWDKLIALNLTAPFLLSQAVAKRWMLPRKYGKIVNVASVEGMYGHHPRMIGTIAYNSSKGGLINFTRALAAEWAQYGINVNAVAPGYFPSKLTGYVISKFEKELVDDTPRGQLGDEADLKGATLLLSSSACAHINGQVIVVDGGASII